MHAYHLQSSKKSDVFAEGTFGIASHSGSAKLKRGFGPIHRTAVVRRGVVVRVWFDLKNIAKCIAASWPKALRHGRLSAHKSDAIVDIEVTLSRDQERRNGIAVG